MSIRSNHDAAGDGDSNAYEREREARIAANRARMSALGLVSNSSSGAGGIGFRSSSSTSSAMPPLGGGGGAPSAWSKAIFGATERPKVKRRPMVTILEPATRPTRSSRRLQELQASGNKPRSYAEMDEGGGGRRGRQHDHLQRRGGVRRRKCFLSTDGFFDGENDENARASSSSSSLRPGASRRGLLVPTSPSRGGGTRSSKPTSETNPDDGGGGGVKTTYAAPFSLRSIDVTVWSLGQIHRGGWAWRYWSSPGCLYHHAYPVGYRATKQGVFGGDWECRVEEGECGPVFVVEEVVFVDGGEEGGEGGGGGGGGGGTTTAAAAAAAAAPRRSFSGPSPTRPWTDACLSHRTGQRISGPLFFGFSDPTTQRAVASLYTPDELAAARRGEGGKRREGAAAAEAEAEVAEKGDDGNDKTALSASSLATERAALDFVARYGVGEATACVLAHTTALSGSRFRSADELEAWARGGKGGESSSEPFVVVDAAALEAGHGWPPRARALLDFLLGSEEFPASTRRWPVWRQRLAPRLVVAVCGLVLEAEKKERGGDEEEATAGVAAVAAAAAEAGVVAAADQEVEEKEKPRANRGKKRATAAGAAPRTTRNKA